MTPRLWLILGGVLGGLGVGIGAFGAHGLPDYLATFDPPLSADVIARRLDTFQTGVHYHQLHAVALVLVGLAARNKPNRLLNLAGFLFLDGLVLFSGLLYALVLTGMTQLGMIVPFGGVAFIVGWVLLAAGAGNDFD